MTRADDGEPPVLDGGDRLEARLRGANGLLVGLDFDGTLAPIVDDPDDATVDPAAIEPLETLRDRRDATVAVVSGRALPDLAERVPIEGATLAGNHGLEVQRDGTREVVPAAADARDALRAARNRLADTAAAVPGCRIEDKGLTLSVHVRETPPARVDEVRTAVEEAAGATDDLRLVAGKAVFELRPAVDHDKGTVVASLRADAPDDWLVLYLGDDTTDEDAFRAIQPAGVGVHVGPDDETAATVRLPDQSAVAPFLRWLAAEPVGSEA